MDEQARMRERLAQDPYRPEDEGPCHAEWLRRYGGQEKPVQGQETASDKDDVLGIMVPVGPRALATISRVAQAWDIPLLEVLETALVEGCVQLERDLG